jgi:hypothetical protein
MWTLIILLIISLGLNVTISFLWCYSDIRANKEIRELKIILDAYKKEIFRLGSELDGHKKAVEVLKGESELKWPS